MGKLSREDVALVFASALMQKNGSLSPEGILTCFDTADDFLSHKKWDEMKTLHIKEVSEAEKTRTCGCGHKLKNGERIYDHGWNVGWECSNCH